MKQINSIQIWKEGSLKTGTQLNVNIFRDNLKDSALFSYEIFTEGGELLSNGEVKISGDDYSNWTDNDFAWNFVADKLSLTIIN